MKHKTDSSTGNGRRKWRVEVVVAVVATIGTLGAALLANIDKLSRPPAVVTTDLSRSADELKTLSRSADELTSLLAERAEEVSLYLRTLREDALDFLQKENVTANAPTAKFAPATQIGSANFVSPSAARALLKQLDDIEPEFRNLHNRHVELIKQGKLTAAHEIDNDIDRLIDKLLSAANRAYAPGKDVHYLTAYAVAPKYPKLMCRKYKSHPRYDSDSKRQILPSCRNE